MTTAIKLYVCPPSAPRRVFKLLPDRVYLIGRGSNATVRLDDPRVSRSHLKLTYEKDRVSLTNLSNNTGTFVNGHKIAETVAGKTGDEILVGETKLFLSGFHVENEAGSTDSQLHSEIHSLVGRWLSNFFLKAVIGVGRTGLVFRAFDENRNQDVAIKVFSRHYTSCENRRGRLIASTRAFCNVRGPHLIPMYQSGKNSAAYFYTAMKLIEGHSVDTLIQRAGIEGMLDWQEVWRCACEITAALSCVYEHDLVHRNVTPTNIIRRSADKSYFLGDFSFSTAIEPDEKARRGEEFFSQVHFLPPERVRGDSTDLRDGFGGLPLTGVADIRSDIFGLGATCYAMLTGKPPAQGTDLNELVDNIRRVNPPLPTQSHLSVNEHFEAVVMKMISKNPEDRYREPRVLLKALYRIGRLSGMDI